MCDATTVTCMLAMFAHPVLAHGQANAWLTSDLIQPRAAWQRHGNFCTSLLEFCLPAAAYELIPGRSFHVCILQKANTLSTLSNWLSFFLFNKSSSF